jgi:MFS family permease
VRPYARLIRRNPDFRKVYLATLISLGGDWFALIPLLNLLAAATGSGLWGGLVLAADTALIALVSPYAGSAVDRLDRRRVLVVADLASAALVVALVLVHSPGTAWVAIVAIGGVAVAKAFYNPASAAALPNLVDPDDLAVANILVGAAWGTMLAVGAGIGGLLDVALGPQACFLIDAASFLLSASLIARTKRPFQEKRERPDGSSRRHRLVSDVGDAIRHICRAPRVAALVTVKSAVGLGNGVLPLFPLLATAAFGVGPVGTGLLFAARGLGAVLGPLVLRRWATEERWMWRVMFGGMLAYGVAYGIFAVTPWFGAALILVVVAHFGGGANWIISTYALQAAVPDSLRGRVFSVDFMVTTLAIAASQAGAGLLSDVVEARALAAASGGVTAGYGVVWWLAARRARGSVPDLE